MAENNVAIESAGSKNDEQEITRRRNPKETEEDSGKKQVRRSLKNALRNNDKDTSRKKKKEQNERVATPREQNSSKEPLTGEKNESGKSPKKRSAPSKSSSPKKRKKPSEEIITMGEYGCKNDHKTLFLLTVKRTKDILQRERDMRTAPAKGATARLWLLPQEDFNTVLHKALLFISAPMQFIVVMLFTVSHAMQTWVVHHAGEREHACKQVGPKALKIYIG